MIILCASSASQSGETEIYIEIKTEMETDGDKKTEHE